MDWKDDRIKKIDQFYIAVNPINYNKDNILKFLDNRSTNASTESFNCKIKLFRAKFRSLSDIKFFLLRLIKFVV